METALLHECKEYINANKFEEFKEFYKELTESEFEKEPDWPNLYQKVYLHACLKKRHNIAEWLETLFTQFPPITQIAYRQLFFYGHVLLRRGSQA
jgi:hypothetical protein